MYTTSAEVESNTPYCIITTNRVQPRSPPAAASSRHSRVLPRIVSLIGAALLRPGSLRAWSHTAVLHCYHLKPAQESMPFPPAVSFCVD